MALRELPEQVNPGDELEIQLAPFGDWPNTAAGEDGETIEIVQHLNAENCQKIIDAFDGERLVDVDHISVEGGSTLAYAWVTSLRLDPELGLMGTFKFTDKGAEAVNSREYRFVSVCWYCDDGGNPYELDSVALTNRPNLPVRPILNRKQTAKQPVVNADDITKGKPEMDKLIELLGLSPEATEEDVLAAVTAIKSERDELKAAAENAEAEEFAEEHKDCVEDKCELKNAYLVNKELAKAMIANCKKPAAPVVVKPITAENAAKPNIADVRAQMAALPPSKRAAYYKEHKADFEA